MVSIHRYKCCICPLVPAGVFELDQILYGLHCCSGMKPETPSCTDVGMLEKSFH